MTTDTTPATWILDAIASGDRFDRIGDRHFSITHPGEPVFRVSVAEVPRDDPRGNFWGWLERDGAGCPGPPVMIRRRWAEFSMQFTYGPEAEQECGKGVIVRLDVRATPGDCPECGGTGEVEVDGHTCGTGPEGHYGAHEPGCGAEPCPRGCPYVPYADRLAKAAGEGTAP